MAETSPEPGPPGQGSGTLAEVGGGGVRIMVRSSRPGLLLMERRGIMISGVILAEQIGAVGGRSLVMQEMIQPFEIDHSAVPGKIRQKAEQNECNDEPVCA